MNRPCSPSVINALYRRYLFQAISDFTAVATSAVAIFSHAHFSRSSDILRSTRSSYSFRETSRLISAYCSLVISADFQWGAKADLTILLMPSLASIDMVARTGEVSCERGSATGLCLLGRG